MPSCTILRGWQPLNVSFGRLPEMSAAANVCCCLLVHSRTSSSSEHFLHFLVVSVTVQSKISPYAHESSVHSRAHPLPQSV